MPEKAMVGINQLLLAIAIAALSLPVRASLVGQTVDFTFLETGFSNVAVSNVAVTDPGVELDGNDTPQNAIRQAEIMSNSESIDLGALSIVFTIESLFEDPVNNSLETTGFEGDARYEISGFDQSLLALFEIGAGDTFAIALDNISGVSLQSDTTAGSGLVVDTSTNVITLFMASIRIGNEIVGGPDIGTITLSVNEADIGVVPLPAALPLMLSALAIIGFVARRRQSA